MKSADAPPRRGGGSGSGRSSHHLRRPHADQQQSDENQRPKTDHASEVDVSWGNFSLELNMRRSEGWDDARRWREAKPCASF